MELHSRPLFRNGQERKGFSLLGKTENGDGVADETIFSELTGAQGFLLLGKTENGDGR